MNERAQKLLPILVEISIAYRFSYAEDSCSSPKRSETIPGKVIHYSSVTPGKVIH